MRKIFTNDKFFCVSVVLSVIGMLIYATRMFCRTFATTEIFYLSYGLTHIVYPVSLVVLYITYKRHNKNVMKAMAGALMMTLVLDSFTYLQSFRPFDITFSIFYIIVTAGLFINHMLINGTHHSSRANVTINQVLALLVALCHIVWFVYTLSNFISDPWITISFVGYVFGYVFMAISIVCVESRLDAYRLDREAAGWTEEEGYPEGYVHEYQKSKK